MSPLFSASLGLAAPLMTTGLTCSPCSRATRVTTSQISSSTPPRPPTRSGPACAAGMAPDIAATEAPAASPRRNTRLSIAQSFQESTGTDQQESINRHRGATHGQRRGPGPAGGGKARGIGRGAWRGRGEISGVAGSLKKKKEDAGGRSVERSISAHVGGRRLMYVLRCSLKLSDQHRRRLQVRCTVCVWSVCVITGYGAS